MKLDFKNSAISKVLLTLLIGGALSFTIFIFYFLPPRQLPQPFNSLVDLSLYASTLEEFPQIDGTDRLEPDYLSFFKTTTPTWLTRWLYKLKMNQNMTCINAGLFKKLLINATKQQHPTESTEAHVLKISSQPNSNFILFGNLHSAFHSLVRDLEKLKELEIINTNFEITKSNHYIIFNGNAINFSPYSMETLILILTLINKNPDKVFYLQGQHENELFFTAGIAKEFEFKFKHLSNQKTPLKNELLRFFENLPLAVYINTKVSVFSNFIRISHFDTSDYPLINEIFYADTLREKTTAIQKIKINTQTTSKKTVKLESVFKAPDLTQNIPQTNGLIRLKPEKNVTNWALLSCPVSTYKILYNFFHDAFCIISINNKNKWTISLYSQDAGNKTGFTKTQFNLFENNNEK